MATISHPRTLRLVAWVTLGSSLAVGSARAATFTVTSTNNAGAGTLRAALTNANGSPGLDTIDFNGVSAATTTPGR